MARPRVLSDEQRQHNRTEQGRKATYLCRGCKATIWFEANLTPQVCAFCGLPVDAPVSTPADVPKPIEPWKRVTAVRPKQLLAPEYVRRAPNFYSEYANTNHLKVTSEVEAPRGDDAEQMEMEFA